MGGNSFGRLFRVTTFGESHGPALGCVIDGCPAGLPLSLEDIRRELRRRRPGQGGPASTERGEEDEPEILSGVFEGKTLGTPIAIIVRNRDHRSADYDELRDLYRPGHGDYTWEAKYGVRDHRGGGRSSGRETLCRVAAGAAAKVFLAAAGIGIRAWTSSIAGIDLPGSGTPGFDPDEIEKNPFRVPAVEQVEAITGKIEALRRAGDSAGGAVSCSVTGLMPGLGEPVFDKLDARIAAAMLSIGAARAIEFGAGFETIRRRGSEHNDVPEPAAGTGPEPPALRFRTNHAGGVLGGISSGAPLEFRVAFKPAASIAMRQETVNRRGERVALRIRGRHDACIVPRAVPVVEAMTALVLADFLLLKRRDRA
ncbi:MAG: chorismate synthase [Treponema sp.]|jgi:chorismate synthase|nr:chorismate synthase [Treponema sp.]